MMLFNLSISVAKTEEPGLVKALISFQSEGVVMDFSRLMPEGFKGNWDFLAATLNFISEAVEPKEKACGV